MSDYLIFRNNLGKVDAVNRADGATVYLSDPTHPFTIELREWEKINGPLDLSDHEPVPLPDLEKAADQIFVSRLVSAMKASGKDFTPAEVDQMRSMTDESKESQA